MNSAFASSVLSCVIMFAIFVASVSTATFNAHDIASERAYFEYGRLVLPNPPCLEVVGRSSTTVMHGVDACSKMNCAAFCASQN